MKVDIALQCNPTNLIREVFVKWRKCQCSPYNWRTILEALSSLVVDERRLAISVATALRREKSGQPSLQLQGVRRPHPQSPPPPSPKRSNSDQNWKWVFVLVGINDELILQTHSVHCTLLLISHHSLLWGTTSQYQWWALLTLYKNLHQPTSEWITHTHTHTHINTEFLYNIPPFIVINWRPLLKHFTVMTVDRNFGVSVLRGERKRPHPLSPSPG